MRALCSYLVTNLTYSQLFLVSAVFPLIGLVSLGLYTLNPQKLIVVETKSPTLGLGESLKKIFSNRNVMLLSYCRASLSASQSIFLALFSIYAVQQLGFSESMVAMLFTVRGFTNTISRFPAGRLSDKIGRRTPMVAAYEMHVISFFIISFSGSVLMLGIALGLYGLCWGTRAVSEWALLTDLVEPEIKTISISYLSSVFGFGSTLGSVASGVLAVVFPYSFIFLIGALLNLGAIPAVLIMKKRF